MTQIVERLGLGMGIEMGMGDEMGMGNGNDDHGEGYQRPITFKPLEI